MMALCMVGAIEATGIDGGDAGRQGFHRLRLAQRLVEVSTDALRDCRDKGAAPDETGRPLDGESYTFAIIGQ